MKRPLKYGHRVHPEVAADILELKEEQIMQKALLTIRKILTAEVVGKELETHRATGNLTDCRKVLFDVREDISPRFRVVYREIRDDLEIVAIETLAVGDRFELEAYLKAAIRLGRINPKASPSG